MSEREIGTILEAVSQITRRQDSFEGKLDNLIGLLEDKFVQRIEFEPVAKTVENIRGWAMRLVLTGLTGAAIIGLTVFK